MPFQNKQQEQPKQLSEKEEIAAVKKAKDELAFYSAKIAEAKEIFESQGERVGATLATGNASELEAEIERLKGIKETALAELLEVQGKVSNVKDELKGISEEVASGKETIKTQTSIIEENKEEITKLESSLVTIKSNHEAKKKELESEISSLDEQKSIKTVELSQIQTATAKAVTDKSVAEAALKSKQDELAAIVKQVASEKERLVEAEKNVKAAESKAEKISLKNAETEKTFNAEMEAERKQLEAEKTALANKQVAFAEEVKWNDYRTDTLKKIKIDWEQRHGMRITTIQFPEKTPPQK